MASCGREKKEPQSFRFLPSATIQDDPVVSASAAVNETCQRSWEPSRPALARWPKRFLQRLWVYRVFERFDFGDRALGPLASSDPWALLKLRKGRESAGQAGNTGTGT
jgi:hypothetical protein